MLLSSHSLMDAPRRGRRSSRTEKPPKDTTSFREILACLDGSELGSGIMPHAHAIARALGGHLTLLHVLETETSVDPPDPLDWEIRQREARAHLGDLAADLGDLEPGVRAELIQGRAAEQICSFVEQHDVDLTVFCSHGARGLTDWSLASTARKLIERTPGSLLLVPAGAAAEAGEVRYRRVLVPLDGSPRAESVLPVATRIAAFHKAELLLVHVIPVPDLTRVGPLDAEGADLERRVVAHNQRVANAYLERLRARAGRVGSRVRTLVVEDGSVRTRLERVIREERADLVVMSAHGHTGRTDSPCGSATEYAVTHATTPLLVVRERTPRRARRVDPSALQPRDRVIPHGYAIP
jgi:nucleotide-binding universal stress UspA family protein